MDKLKAIELKSKHRQELLKMCKTLFPITTKEYYGIYDDLAHANDHLCLCKKSNDDIIWSIHWFEFCMTNLLVKIRSFKSKETPEELMDFYGIYWEISNYNLTKIHPIDYLYQEFKKLK